jgi:hypothetical protein
MKHQRIRLAVSGLALGAALVAPTERAQACGGFFCSAQQGVNQAAERIIFADNGDGTITAVIQIQYQGPAERFSWLLPISTVPEGDDLALASDLAFTRLQLATNPQYSLTTRYEGSCAASRNAAVATDIAPRDESCSDNALLSGCGPRVSVEASGVLGAFEWSVIRVSDPTADPAAPALEWLQQNGYDVTPEGAALIGPYLADGMFLLALKLSKGSDTGSIRPIQLNYAAAAPMIPIKLTAVAANQDMGVMTWALSNGRAVPFNYNALELNEARINWFNASSNYNQVVTEAADAAGGQGFVTEFAGPSQRLANLIWTPSEEAQWQSMRSNTYRSFESLFQTLWSSYQSYDGFWDALRSAVVLPQGLSFEDFRACPTCYSEGIEFSPGQLFAAIEASVIEPMRSVQRLFARVPYTTRLYSTLSAAEMTLDPVFVFNPDLPELSNIHRAERVVECARGRSEFDSPWRIEFPQGSVVRGTAETIGQWPDALGAQPANFRVSTLSTSGAGRVVDDNSDEITTVLAAYNSGLPGSAADGTGERGGFCSLGARPGGDGPWPLGLGMSVLLGSSWLRRRAQTRKGCV